NALKNSNRPMTASELAEELDCAYQAINHRVKRHSKVIFYKFVIRDKKDGDKAYFSISENGKLFLAGMYEG
ncbi:helix-turn-helix domain-containing protein, partial [Providencia rustigianii]|uniref:hypothetical protein n=1 Tax=Providencia rustigianii TaxID=158850 RepID=UPI0022401254